MTLREAAQRLGLGLTIVRRMIAEKKLPASQVITCAPWQIPAEALQSETVRAEVENIRKGVRAPRTAAGSMGSRHCFQRVSEV